MHQHRLTRPHTRHIHQRIKRRHERHRNRSRLDERPTLRNRHHHPLIHHDGGPEPVPPDTHDPVTDHHTPHTGTDPGHHTRALTAHPRVLRIRVHAQRHQHVTEVEPDSPDLDTHLALAQDAGAPSSDGGPGRSRRGCRSRRGSRHCQVSSSPGSSGCCRDRQSCGAAGSSPRRRASCGSPVARAEGQGGAARPGSSVQVGQDEPAGVFGLRGTHQAPDGRRREVRHALARPGRYGSPGDAAPAWRRSPRSARRPAMLHERQRTAGGGQRPSSPVSPSPGLARVDGHAGSGARRLVQHVRRCRAPAAGQIGRRGRSGRRDATRCRRARRPAVPGPRPRAPATGRRAPRRRPVPVRGSSAHGGRAPPPRRAPAPAPVERAGHESSAESDRPRLRRPPRAPTCPRRSTGVSRDAQARRPGGVQGHAGPEERQSGRMASRCVLRGPARRAGRRQGAPGAGRTRRCAGPRRAG